MSSEFFIKNLESKSNEKSWKAGPMLAKVLASVVGLAGFGATVIALPFISPALRRHCLPYVPATAAQIENVLLAVKAARSWPTVEGVKRRLIDLGSGDGRVVSRKSSIFVFCPVSD